MNLCGAQWLAYALPCRRFAAALTDVHARLRVDVDRYSFIVSDLHRLLVAGLPAHCERFWTLPRTGAPWRDVPEKYGKWNNLPTLPALERLRRLGERGRRSRPDDGRDRILRHRHPYSSPPCPPTSRRPR